MRPFIQNRDAQARRQSHRHFRGTQADVGKSRDRFIKSAEHTAADIGDDQSIRTFAAEFLTNRGGIQACSRADIGLHKHQDVKLLLLKFHAKRGEVRLRSVSRIK